jgi:hypothetical protein
MTRYSKYNIVYRLQKWMDSVPGQTFLNYAYSWGASIVILGTLFKLTHLPGADFFLFLGMGTEVFVFFISAFDRPFDKTTDGMELDTHMITGDDMVESTAGTESNLVGSKGSNGGSSTVIGGNGGTIIIGGGNAQTKVDTEAIAAVSSSVASVSGTPVQPGASAQTAITGIPSVNPELEEATANYVDELKRLTEMLSRVSEQSERLARDSEEMETMNRTLTGINRFYELQLKSVGTQSSTIDDVNEQTKRLAAQLQELNEVYAKMVEALKMKIS